MRIEGVSRATLREMDEEYRRCAVQEIAVDAREARDRGAELERELEHRSAGAVATLRRQGECAAQLRNARVEHELLAEAKQQQQHRIQRVRRSRQADDTRATHQQAAIADAHAQLRSAQRQEIAVQDGAERLERLDARLAERRAPSLLFSNTGVTTGVTRTLSETLHSSPSQGARGDSAATRARAPNRQTTRALRGRRPKQPALPLPLQLFASQRRVYLPALFKLKLSLSLSLSRKKVSRMGAWESQREGRALCVCRRRFAGAAELDDRLADGHSILQGLSDDEASVDSAANYSQHVHQTPQHALHWPGARAPSTSPLRRRDSADLDDSRQANLDLQRIWKRSLN